MTKRLVDLYQPGEMVEITFEGARWMVAKVLLHQHPGLWVATGDGRFWFVTNGRRIRKRDYLGEDRSESCDRRS